LFQEKQQHTRPPSNLQAATRCLQVRAAAAGLPGCKANRARNVWAPSLPGVWRAATYRPATLGFIRVIDSIWKDRSCARRTRAKLTRNDHDARAEAAW